nr:immunoglobulin light chain junction region [Macaca mulatta]
VYYCSPYAGTNTVLF